MNNEENEYTRGVSDDEDEHQEKPICLAMANMYFFTKKWPGMAFLACLLDNVSQIHESHAMTRLHFSRSFS